MRLEGAEGQLVGEQLEYKYAKRENVGGREYGGSPTGPHGLLWRHIGVCTEDLVGFAENVSLGHTVRSVSGNSKICQCSLAILLEEHILRLQVTMHLSTVVQGIEPDENVLANLRGT